ncbi:hypothetical protein [Catellatospora tritici]|uniref:hypothetical protein n=1 Tax=Catellatospora tritici TaxID=2851566 RepID=UPI001C2CC6DA|nr:hypothetical protein [Catellatospora tritici]MBV1856597.1 hypothetical protein [Catellatospora tritici]
MRVRTRISTVRLGGTEYRVVRPLRPLNRAVLYTEPHGIPTEPHNLAMFVGRTEAVVLTALWGLAVCSPRSIVYIPMRHATPPADIPPGPVPLDLVLMHHSLQLPVSRWKEIRARLDAGTAHRATVPPYALHSRDDGAATHTYRDPLRVDIAAHTVYLTGSATAFRDPGTSLLELTREAGGYLKSIDGRHHYCVELGDHDTHPWFKRRRRFPTQVHVQYCPRWIAG